MHPDDKGLMRHLPVKNMTDNRIGVLDSFRFFAISLVVLYHYYSRWAYAVPGISKYASGTVFKNAICDNGFLGVQLFFIISGFVIYFTIVKSRSAGDFFKRRFIRLFPPILLCSIITFLFVRNIGLPTEFLAFYRQPAGFLPSLSFTDEIFWQRLLNNDGAQYMDPAYWSLVVEVKFYILVAIFYFLSKKHFLRNWTALVAVLFLVNIAGYSGLVDASGKYAVKQVYLYITTIFFTSYIAYFTLGLYFYDYYVNRKLKVWFLLPIAMLAVYSTPNMLGYYLYAAAFIVLFFLFVYNSNFFKFLDTGFFRRAGVISYTIYLLHQDIGIVVIRKMSDALPQGFGQVLIPVLVYGGFMVVSELIYRFYELPSKRVLSHLFIKKQA